MAIFDEKIEIRERCKVVVKYDFRNAYNSLTRKAAREGLAHAARAVLASHAVALPDVAPTLASGVTTHWCCLLYTSDAADE